LKAVLFANSDWYLFNFSLALARRLKASGYDVLLLSPPGAYGGRLREVGLSWQPVPMNRQSLNPLRELRLVARLIGIYRRERPDIVHHFTIKCVVYGAIAATLAGVPARINAVTGLGHVFTSSSLRARLLRPLVRAMMRWALTAKRSRLILQNSDDVANLGIFADGWKIRLIKGSGVDISRFRPGRKPVLTGETTRVLLASRLLWDKGLGEYVEAARRLLGAGLPMRFRIAGAPDPGNPASIPQAQLDAWAAEGAVEPLGHVEDMPAELARTDIFVLPSYYGEGLPRSLIEAAASALPLIATDRPGCRDVVSDGENGLIVAARDAAALAAAIRRLHDNPVWARKLGQAARNKALAEFDQRTVISRTLEVYAELLAINAEMAVIGIHSVRNSWAGLASRARQVVRSPAVTAANTAPPAVRTAVTGENDQGISIRK